MKQHNQPIIAIIGRPNVGKSTLFNRIIGRRQASVYDLPGLTRDRNYALAQWGNKTFLLVDTGGYEIEEQDDISKGVREQVLMAMDEADAIVFLTEVALSDHPVDHEIIHMLRRSSKPFAVAVNKCDNQEQQMDAYAMAALGADHLHIISATHGLGIGELLDDITKTLPADEEGDEPADDQIRVAIVGRQNVGKSTLTNRILGTERVLATPVAGTTRDAVDTPFHFNGKDYIIVDTAGIRRRGKIEHGPESLSVTSSIMSIQRCDVAILVLDARDGITAQDTHIGGYIQESGRAAIIAVNKWDAVEKDTATAGTFAKKVMEDFKYIPWAPIIFISALSGQRVFKVFSLIEEIMPQYQARFETSHLNDVLKEAVSHHQPPIHRGRQIKIKYVTQIRTGPPTFAFFVNNPALMHFSYERYLMNQFAERLGLNRTPIIMKYRRK